MDDMRADMGGAACVLSTLYAARRSVEKLSRDVVVLIPLVENMPSHSATHPGDIVIARNGKSIKIDNTDAEGRLILADALCYADTFNPEHVIDVATLTGSIIIALGGAATGLYANNEVLSQSLLTSSVDTGDRLWRMPLFKYYVSRMKTDYADLNNIGKTNSGGSCTAAAFLQEFTECKSWAHLDIASVMQADGEISYISKGMTGRPTRTLTKWLLTEGQK